MENNAILEVLEQRFNTHMYRHENISWNDVYQLLSNDKETLKVIKKMEETGGEPDLIVLDGVWYYMDLAKETPKGRVNTCYDQKARLERKKFPPQTSALELAESIGINLLDEDMYHKVQVVESLDLKTSSWLLTPEAQRKLKGALFGDRRYDRVFIYHNGADSYYGVRGFRGYIEIKS